MYNYSNFQYNPYSYSYTPVGAGANPYQPNNRQEVTKVNGMDGANAYPLSANSSVLLLDINNPVVYLKQSDGGGFCSVTPYGITPIEQKQNASTDTTDLEKRITRLEKLYESNITTLAELTQSKPTQPSAEH